VGQGGVGRKKGERRWAVAQGGRRGRRWVVVQDGWRRFLEKGIRTRGGRNKEIKNNKEN
jgi:hypothetical protein